MKCKFVAKSKYIVDTFVIPCCRPVWYYEDKIKTGGTYGYHR